jgi:aspartate carbamoyltransferase regulatory subunit
MSMIVRPIENGTVVDHVPAGRGLEVYNLLKGNNGISIVLMNVSSTRMGRKDIVKLEGTIVPPSRLDLISLIAPEASINIIKDGKVVEKRRASLPSEITGLLKCLNPNCITNSPREPLRTRFSVSRSPTRLQCTYCAKEFDERIASTITQK